VSGPTDLDRAIKAKALLDDPTLTGAFDAVRTSIINAIEACPLAATDSAEDLRRCLRLLKAVRTNLEVAVQSGKVVEFRLAQEAERKKNPLRGLFR
jgi:hypothetical protein